MTDPCAGCRHLVIRPLLAPYCDRNAHYGQAYCLRATRPAQPTQTSRSERRRG